MPKTTIQNNKLEEGHDRMNTLTKTSVRGSLLRFAIIFGAFGLTCLALLPTSQAVVPAPDGGYPNGNTAEGQNALLSLAAGGFNTAIGFLSQSSVTTGGFNTAVGAGTLLANTADQNTAIGTGALLSNTTGAFNTADGAFALFLNTTGDFNTAVGDSALFNNTTGEENTAVGDHTLVLNTIGNSNTAIGTDAMFSNTTGSLNTAIGQEALAFNTSGTGNTAIGCNALDTNSSGVENTATGHFALAANTTGIQNTAHGSGALRLNTTGNDNTATGFNALLSNTGNFGIGNTADGSEALRNNTVGQFNTAVGRNALRNNTAGENNTAIGTAVMINNTTGSDNIALGSNAGFNLTTGGDNIDIANLGVAGESGTIRIGDVTLQARTFIAGIHGVTVSGGSAVFIKSDGQLGTSTSSARFKDEIKPMDQASEVILALKPVTFRYKKEIDPQGLPQFGLVAEEVEKVNPDLVVRDAQGKAYSVRYDQVNAMLLNEFLKEHRTVQELKNEVASLTATVKEQAAQIQKVSAQLEVSQPVPRMVANDQ